MRSPISWFGGKNFLAPKIISLFPPHKIYVEVFGGGAQVLFAKKPSPVEVYNDIDEGLVNFFRVLRDPDKFERFFKLASLTPYSRREWEDCRSSLGYSYSSERGIVYNGEEVDRPIRDDGDDVIRAFEWYVVARQSFSGNWGEGWAYTVTKVARGICGRVSQWLSTVDMLPEAAARLLMVQVECADWRDILSAYDTPDTLFYCDPPYIHETRRSHKYVYEVSIEDHEELVRRLLAIKGKATVSGYYHETYAPLEEAGWTRYEWNVSAIAVGNTRGVLGGKDEEEIKKLKSRTECLWVKPWDELEGLPLFQ